MGAQAWLYAVGLHSSGKRHIIGSCCLMFGRENMESNVTEIVTNLVLQMGVIIFAARLGGNLAKKAGISSVLGELIAGIIIGPFALGSLPLPGFPSGFFPVYSESLAVTPELYSFSMVASIILLFASGLETDLTLFLRYSVAGGIIGIGGVAFSFVLGDLAAMALFQTHFMDTRCLFLGIMSTATSVGITARILSDKREMDSPEGVTILASAVFDDVLGIILLAVVMGIVAVLNSAGGSVDGAAIAVIAAKAFGIWLAFTALGLIFSKKIAGFLKLFKHSYDFSICALGLALLLGGFFQKQGLAMIIGAYITGLSLSGTDIAAVIQERIRGLYDFFVPMFFAVMGMQVNITELMSGSVLTFGLITPYMVLPVGFGKIYLNNILLDNITRNGMEVHASQASPAMLIPALGMVAGLLIAVFFSYRRPRIYKAAETEKMVETTEPVEIKPFNVLVGIAAILMALVVQIFLDSLLVGALLAVMVFVIAGVIRLRDTQDVFVQGVHLMGGIGIVMIAAAGFANVMKETGGVSELVSLVQGAALDYKGVTVFAMLLIGLIITMGIGSSFSTVPLIAAIYVPLCAAMGLSPLATIAIVGSAGALGDAGSPVSESVLGPTAGLNADGQHDHIYDSTIPTFLHYNLPLLVAGWIAGMVL